MRDRTKVTFRLGGHRTERPPPGACDGPTAARGAGNRRARPPACGAGIGSPAPFRDASVTMDPLWLIGWGWGSLLPPKPRRGVGPPSAPMRRADTCGLSCCHDILTEI